ncbi:MAG: hypothetical protein Q9191_003095, partial [Dirinaria sp. TL-2023a]
MALQKLRNCVLEIFHRLPMNHVEALKPYADGIVGLLMELVRKENEDNAILCMKTVMDLERYQTEATASKIQPFLNLIQEMFENVEQVVQNTFDTPAASGTAAGNSQSFQSPRPNSPSASVASDLSIDMQTNRPLLKGMDSFKVFAECPIIVVSLFQAHRNSTPSNVKKFLPLIKVVLMLQAKPQERAHEEARQRGENFIGVSKEIKNQAAFGDFITAQVKVMSFLAYLLRVYYSHMNDFLPKLPEIVVRLLRDCPSEKSATRKELLIAIRHTINFNFRKIFLTKIDDLLDARTLIGDGLTVYETLRPLAYSLLADLIHHVRDTLNRDQIRKTVDVFSMNLHDNFPGTSFQTMSAKLLLNMADSIANLKDKKDARHFLIMILSAIAEKFAAMNRHYRNAVKLSKLYEQQTIDAIAEDHLLDSGNPPDWDDIDIFTATPIKTSNPKDRGANPVDDNKFLFKNLLTGLKGMFYQLRLCNPDTPAMDPANAPPNWSEISHGYDAEEVDVIKKLFREGAHVFRYYSSEQPPTEATYNSPLEFLGNQYMVQSGKEEKELLETFATVFHSIDPATFHEVFHSEIPRLYEMMFEHTALLHIPQFFLASEATSPSFAGMLLQFLMDRIGDVGSSDIKKSSILLRMFKLSFMAVTLFSQPNEPVLLPHVTNIVTKAIQLSTTAEEPMNYFYLLRSLFRSIGGGRFELLYKEILPLLEMLLEVLNNLLLAARKPQERDLYVELCLTVPARLSNLLPHLSYLMRPLVIALRAGSDLVSQGLRTLELCVDNLTAEYLDPIMAPVIDDLMTALWDHLQPTPYSHFHAHTTMRILGKLGGRNRKFLTGPPRLEYKRFADDEPSINIKLIGSAKERAFPAKLGIDLAITRLTESPKALAAKKADPYYKQQAFRLISAQLKLHMGFDRLPDELAQIVRLQAQDLLEARYDAGPDVVLMADREKSVSKKESQEETLKKLLKACMLAATIANLDTVASNLLADVCRHFTILELGRALSRMKQERKEFDVRSGEGPLNLDSHVLADAIVESLSSDNAAVRDVAERAIVNMYEAAGVVMGGKEKADRLPFFSSLADLCCHKCHEEEWFMKAGGGLALHLLVTKIDLGDHWMVTRQTKFIRSLIYVIKDMPQDLPASTRNKALQTIETILRRCSKGVPKGEIQNHQSRLYNTCGFLIHELAHMNKHVRAAAQRSFTTIAEVVEVEIHELLSPVKDRLLHLIYSKPLRVLPLATQIGYIEAITYCLGMQQNLVEFNEPLHRLLTESMALADAEDEALAHKPSEYKAAESILSLRVACIKLLSLAVGFSEFAGQQQTQSRSRIISVFFKSLYSVNPDVIEAANSGLKGVLAQTNKLPKDLLQSGLRPILMNLQNPEKLNVKGLQGLARLLALLTNYFKVEIGERLLSHLAHIATAQALQKSSFALIEQHPQMQIVIAVLNIFHLLPSAAASFMQDLVNKVMDLEDSLRRVHYSPFREPLLKFLNRYAKETWAFFGERMSELKYGRFFAQLLDSSQSDPLRDVVIADIEGLIKTFTDVEDAEKRNVAGVNAVHVVKTICAHQSEWIAEARTFRDTLLSVGKELHQALASDSIAGDLRLAADQAGEQMIDIFVAYMKQRPQDLDFLFQLIEAFTSEAIKQHASFSSYLYNHLISSESIDLWRSLVMRSLDLYSSRSSSQKVKAFVFEKIVNPIFAMDVLRVHQTANVERRFVDKSIVEAIHNKLWKPQLLDTGEENAQPGADHSRLELLQLSALLLKYYHSQVSEARKDIIKFGWSYMKLEDTINKHAAYVLVSYFIAQFETPTKIVNQIYIALLKAHQNEGRALVIQALDLVAPYLPKRLSSAVPADVRYPIWAKWPKKILSEESSNLQQIICIFQFMVRHPDLFYEAREQFVNHIIPSLSKIAPLPNPSNEHKKLVLNLIQMILHWEKVRVRGGDRPSSGSSDSVPAKMRKLDLSQGPTPSSTFSTSSGIAEKTDFVIQMPLRAMLLKYLVQFICTLPERYPLPAAKLREIGSAAQQAPLPPNEMCKKAIWLLHDLLAPDLWVDVDVDIMSRMTDQILASEKTDKGDDKMNTSIINTLQVIRVVLNVKSDEWVLSNLTAIQKILEKPIRFEEPEIQESLHISDQQLDDGRTIRPLLRRILEALPTEEREEDDMEVETPATEFINFISAVATDTMANQILMPSINILWSLVQVRPKEVDQHIQQIINALTSKLAKDQVQPPAPPAQLLASGARATDALDPRELEISTDLALKATDVLSLRMAALGDRRRAFLSILATLVERSANTKLCEKVLSLVEFWVFESNEPWPTLKEKTAVLHKMLGFETRPDPTLLHKFLNLVIRIYEDPRITRTELTVRLEHAFLVGTRAQDVEMRERFMNVFDKSLQKAISARLLYILISQNWDTLSDSFWLSQAIQLVFGAVEMGANVELHEEDFTLISPAQLFGISRDDSRKDKLTLDSQFANFMTDYSRFYASLGDVRARDVLEPLCQLQHTEPQVAYDVWVALFPLCWSLLSRDDRSEIEKGMVTLLTKDYHQRQVDRRPNVVQALLEGIVRAKPKCKFPPHVMKFLSKTYDVWYTTAVALEEAAITPVIDTPTVRESNLDALIEIYAGLQEDDLFYGTWRRRSKFTETNCALSYEQNGMWDKAQEFYEGAQIKARTGSVPFSQGEYMLWEDHWVLCAQKLQQWDILSDFAKHENFNDLLLESAWRTLEIWQQQDQLEQLSSIIKAVSDAPTPRRTFFQAFVSLLRLHEKIEAPQEFSKICDESIQLSIKKWHQLPKRITNAHIPILQNFQQLVELHDANVICNSLAVTTSTNLDTKSQELKLLLGTWRDRLPNVWDDINAWQDLVTWRQHIFQLINRTYLNLLPQNQTNATGNSYAYRGYHETAWIINRFAHVARKHQLPEVCISQLSKIYTLPNIEIQEAFLKLREQAKCHYQNRSELSSGLEVINNTNLNYFGQQQKAEFFTLKGMFLAKLGHKEQANAAFGTALYYDIRLPKAWAEWGVFNDDEFKEKPHEASAGAAAVACYLEAAGQYKNAKSRKLLSRVLWLLSIDSPDGEMAKAFEDFPGETPVWYWITFIPQLLTGLSHSEAHMSRSILVMIAKKYPQALYFLLRTNREDMLAIKKQQDQKQLDSNKAKQQQSPNVKQHSSPEQNARAGSASRPGTANGEDVSNGHTSQPDQPDGSGATKSETNGDTQMGGTDPPAQPVKKPAWDHSEEIMAVLKTAFPFLALTMETMVDQIQKHFKCPPDEDAYRLIVALLNDALAYVSRTPSAYAQDFKLPPATEHNIRRFSQTILPSHIKGSFEEDFVAKRPTMYEYIHKLCKWRDKFEEKLDRRVQHQSLESYSPHLSEFRFGKFDEVEVPGQYLEHADKNQDFVRIERFLPNIDLVRTVGFSHRRLKIRGHDGSVHPFAIQHPAARHSRREERILQLFRIFNGTLSKRKESRRRNLQFFLPRMIPIAPPFRLVQDDASYISLQGIYEDYCRRQSQNKDDPVLFTMDRLRAMSAMSDLRSIRSAEQTMPFKLETFKAIVQKWVPATIAQEYFSATYPSFADFWLFRRRFSYQLAALTFLTYTMHMTSRYPHKLTIARATGNIWGSELAPQMASQRPIFHNPEPVPFRLTPNLQTLMGPLATEGIFVAALQAIARCLIEPEEELEAQLEIFVRDEMIYWMTTQGRGAQGVWGPGLSGVEGLRDVVRENTALIVKRALGLGGTPEGNLPAGQTVIDL